MVCVECTSNIYIYMYIYIHVDIIMPIPSPWNWHTVDGQIIQTLDNYIPHAPTKFQSCFFLPRVETGGQNKSNPTAWHVTHTLFNFDKWGRGCQSNLLLEVWIFCPSTVAPGNTGVGRWVSFWEGLLAGAMLVFGSVHVHILHTTYSNDPIVMEHTLVNQHVLCKPWKSFAPTKNGGSFWNDDKP